MSNSNRKTKNLLIYPTFQFSLIGFQGLMMALAFAIVVIENQMAFSHLRMMGVSSGLNPEHPYFRFVDQQAHSFLLHTSIAFAIALLVSSWITLYLSFKLAGPVLRMKGYFSKIAEQGENGVDVLRFRNGDFFAELPEFVNTAVQRLMKDSKH